MKPIHLLSLILLSIWLIAASCMEAGTGVQIRTDKDGVAMVKVSGGEFLMGSNMGDPDERPEHTVSLETFWIDRYEVTNEMYVLCVKAGRCRGNKKYKGFTGPRQPVVGVSWKNAVDYCDWAGKRLPTEAEWEKAARGAQGRKYPWGDTLDCTRANYRECGTKSTAVAGTYPPGQGPYGAYEMAGNAGEWVRDWYDPEYYRNSPSESPTGPRRGDYKVIRGGMWQRYAYQMRSADRAAQKPETKNTTTGFRCAAGG